MVKLFPSLIASDLLRLQETIERLDSFVQGYHLDVMDFHFVPNLTWGPSFINTIRLASSKQLFVHLMVEFPEHYFPLLQLYKKDIVSFHYESPSHYIAEELCTRIESYGWIPSVALNPETPVELLSLVPSLKHLLLMSVNPGFSGQQFIPATLEKVRQSVAFRTQNSLSFSIAVDGGINERNCKELVLAGAEELAIATAIFKDPDSLKALQRLQKLCTSSC